ncbi:MULTISPECIES: NAD(P)-binding domain-containing protein [Microbacterium]|uniref:NADPH-dependent F420 reductase n=1 Tax=Microbacterium TaxID=33882 RepID=UPI000D65959A|nr:MULTISPECIES: NAD(P)-binding domain-containing protein [Microbacterium]
MSTLGVIGAGQIGSAVARLAVAAGIPVVLANTRGPESLDALIAELGDGATAGTVADASAQEIVVLAVPFTAHDQVPSGPLRGKTVLDPTNYYPYRDGRIAELDDNGITASETVQRAHPGVHIVKAFSNINAPHIPQLARPTGSPDRSTLPVASDSTHAAMEAIDLLDRLGFDAIHTGPLSASWRFEPEAAAYTRIYLADPTVTDEMTAPAAPADESKVRAALQRATRVDVAQRTV